MKTSGSKEKLLSLAATESPANLGSNSLPLSHSPPYPTRQETTDSDIDHWMKGQHEWDQQRIKRTPTVEAGKLAGSPKPPAGSSSSSSSSSVSKQATARQVAAELIRLGDTSLSAPLLSASGTVDNLLPSQVDRDLSKELEHEGIHITAFIEDKRARLQKDREARTEALKIMESSSSVAYVSAEEHALSNERKRKELQDLQGGAITEEQREEWKARNRKAAQDVKAKVPDKEPPATRPPRSIRVASLQELPASFTAAKSVMDMQYCVMNLSDFRTLAGKNQLSKFSDFWAPDHHNTTPMKPAFTPEKLVAGKEPLLARFYDAGRTTAGGEVDPLNPPYFHISRELMGKVIHTLRLEYISDDKNAKMSEEFKEHLKNVLAPLEATLANSATRLEEHHVASMEQHEKLVKDAHDHLTEASGKFKAALIKQVHVMEKHNDRHVVMVEATTDLATTARKQFSNIIFGEDTSREARTSRKIYAESLLEEVEADFKKSQAEWIEERKALNEKIEREKLLNQISDVGVKNYRRK
jgi:hypothetical protein